MHMQQECLDGVSGLYGFPSQSEAVTKSPSFLVKICPMPLKSLDRPMTQYEEVAITVSWHPSFMLWWYIRFSLWHDCRVFTLYHSS